MMSKTDRQRATMSSFHSLRATTINLTTAIEKQHLPVFCDLRAVHKAGSMSHGKPAADAISFTIYSHNHHCQHVIYPFMIDESNNNIL